MPTRRELESIVLGYQQETAVLRNQIQILSQQNTRLNQESITDAFESSNQQVLVEELHDSLQRSEEANRSLLLKVEALDDEAERQEEKILDLEGQMIQPMMATGTTTHNHNYAEIATPGALNFEHVLGTLREPELSFPSQIAICTVAQMLEHRAEHMAIRVGGDAGEYADIVRTVHILRQDIPSDDELEREAEELFEALTTAF